ncbi:MAG: hypothetical protein LUB61_06075, partial [Eggerthellaceae bacterium]|nr:hypothetical protein [Eggerthellaceae bacterium]
MRDINSPENPNAFRYYEDMFEDGCQDYINGWRDVAYRDKTGRTIDMFSLPNLSRASYEHSTGGLTLTIRNHTQDMVDLSIDLHVPRTLFFTSRNGYSRGVKEPDMTVYATDVQTGIKNVTVKNIPNTDNYPEGKLEIFLEVMIKSSVGADEFELDQFARFLLDIPDTESEENECSYDTLDKFMLGINDMIILKELLEAVICMQFEFYCPDEWDLEQTYQLLEMAIPADEDCESQLEIRMQNFEEGVSIINRWGKTYTRNLSQPPRNRFCS